jgi:hypothetical protein
MPEIKEHVVLETKDLDQARATRAAIHAKFEGRRLWLCIVNQGENHKLTVADHWGGRLGDDDAKLVEEFTVQFQKKMKQKEMS